MEDRSSEDDPRSSVDESTSKKDDKNLSGLPADVSSRSHDETVSPAAELSSGIGSRKQRGEIPIQSESEVKSDEDSHHEHEVLRPQYSEKILKETEEKISRVEHNVSELSKKVESIIMQSVPLKVKSQHLEPWHTKENVLANRSSPSIGSTSGSTDPSEGSVRTRSISPQDATSEDKFTSSSHSLVVQSSMSPSLIHPKDSIKEIEERVSRIEGNLKKIETTITDLKTLETAVTDLSKNVETLQQNISLSRNTSCNFLTSNSRESPQTDSLSPQDTRNSSQSSNNFPELTSEDNISQSLPVHTASLTAATCINYFGIPCICQLHHSPLLPLIQKNSLFLFLQTHESTAAGKSNIIKGYIESYSLDNGEKKEKKNITNLKRNVCPTMLLYSKKIAIMTGDNEVETKTVKLALYQCNPSRGTTPFQLEVVVGSKYSSSLVKLKNSACTSYKNDGVIMVSVLDPVTQQASSYMTFHLFSQTKIAGKNWKTASLLLPTVLPSLDKCKYQMQSCVTISDYLYCSLWLHEMIVYVFEIGLLPLEKYDKEYYEGSLPEKSWIIEGPFIKSCFLSVFEEKIVITTFKNINDKTVMEVRMLSSPGEDGSLLNPMCHYDFSSVVKVVTVLAVLPNTITVIYHHEKANKCFTMRLRIPLTDS